MKTYQVLTDESIFEIKRAINFLETFNEQFELPRSKALIADNVEKLKAIIKDVTED